jgi:hypothetical protein
MALLELESTATDARIVAPRFGRFPAIRRVAGQLRSLVMIVIAVWAVNVLAVAFLRCGHGLVLFSLALADDTVILELGEGDTDLRVAFHQHRT